MAVGVHPTFLPMAYAKEKGVDVALAISELGVAFTNRIDLIVLVTGDADFVPLVWALKRRGVRVGVLGFLLFRASARRHAGSGPRKVLVSAYRDFRVEPAPRLQRGASHPAVRSRRAAPPVK